MSEAYGALDRMLHRIVFGSTAITETAVDIEETLFAKFYQDAPPPRPIFVTSLARAGTTVLLEALSRLPGVATHQYSDMPLVRAPILWSKLSGPFRRAGVKTERAHGDGLMIGFESPEAFEETLWVAARPDKFEGPRLALWRPGDLTDAARDDMTRHMRKIIALRSAGRDGGAGWRYVSKNNANMMRAPLLSAAFPDCRIVLPLRRPLDHAVSLWRQHRNFLDRHTEDPFAKRYMADIGHFEFGALHKPFDAPGLDEMIEGRTPDDLDYWLAYWIAVYEYIEADLRARSPENVIVVDPALLRRAPRKALAHLCAALNLPGDEGLDAAAAVITPERTPVDPEVDPNLRERAETVYEVILSRALG